MPEHRASPGGAITIGVGEFSEAGIGATFGGLAALPFSVGMIHSSGEIGMSGWHALAAMAMGGFAIGFNMRL